MKIGHISDLHILEIEDVRPWEFLNKRIIGGLNLLLRRSDNHSPQIVRKALARLGDAGVDHICITGDMTNLALTSEFEAARQLVDEIPDSRERVSVIPGNHDYYTPDAVRERRFETHFADWLHSDLPAYQQESGYPFCKIRDGVAIVGLNSGIATAPMWATGEVDAAQLRAAEALINDPQVRQRFKIVMIHHHLMPFELSRVEYLRRLVNAEEVLSVLRHGDVDLAIHGHNHHFSTVELPHLRGRGTLRICEAGSTSAKTYSNPHFGGKFNIYHIDDGHLSCIETHLFEAYEDAFVHWNEQTFAQRIEEDE